uniref:Uncharacterized protein n=1 Tax=Brassica oleracea var. oleracea TaxID=109376 RepID=A0A0D2ZV20_BRAOL
MHRTFFSTSTTEAVSVLKVFFSSLQYLPTNFKSPVASLKTRLTIALLSHGSPVAKSLYIM